jgi:hypothetical protein
MSTNPYSIKNQEERIEKVRQGLAVVANSQRERDQRLREWARKKNKLTPVGKGTVWENPHQPKRWREAEHQHAADQYRDWILTQPALQDRLSELKGRVLVSDCYPWPSNATVLAELANGGGEKVVDSICTEKVLIHHLTLDEQFQAREKTDFEAIRDYARAYEESPEAMPAIDVFRVGDALIVADGFHRVQAAKQAGLKEINANIRERTDDDKSAVLYAASANATHGVRRTQADKQRQVRMALSVKPGWSDRQIARHTGTSNTFVGQVRKALTVNVDSETQERTYTTRHGTPAVMKVENIGKPRVGEAPIDDLHDEPEARMQDANTLSIDTPDTLPVDTEAAPIPLGDEQERIERIRRGEAVVVNRERDASLIAWARQEGLLVYVGRTTGKDSWGNPFYLGIDGTRDEVCDAYRDHYLPFKKSLMQAIHTLKGKRLSAIAILSVAMPIRWRHWRTALLYRLTKGVICEPTTR